MDILLEAKKVFNLEITALEKTRDFLDNTFVEVLNYITNCNGKIIVTGIGKSGHIARKIAATFSSLGTSSFYLHPAEALHGDLGMVTNKDVIIAISYSGESEEIIQILPSVRYIGAKIIAITGNGNSMLARHSDIVQKFPDFHEACHMGLAPTSSTTAALAYGDALAIVASKLYGFSKKDFGIFHPSGTLGKKLRFQVKDLMKSGANCPQVSIHSTLREAIIELSQKGLGIVVITDGNDIQGVITDGDLRRFLEKGVDIYHLNVENVMSKNPFYTFEDTMAIQALKNLRSKNISSLIVKNHHEQFLGIIRLQDIIDAGII